MANSAYYYGSFQLNDGVNYFVLGKDFSLPSYKQTLFQVARLEGVKKTGERVNEKQISVKMKVVGSSRLDLESKIDALLAALAMRQQQLLLHSEDARYWIADATSAQVALAPGKVVAADVAVQFVAQQPYPFAPSSSSYGSGNLVMASGGGSSWSLPSASNPLSVVGGGNVFARPTITITNQTAPNATTLASGLTSGTAYTTLSVAALPQAATSGQTFLLVSGTHSQRVTLSANALAGATSLTVTSFSANFSYPSSCFCGLDVYLQGFTLSQNPDGQVLSVSSGTLGVQDVGQSDQLTIDCDPTTPNGFTVIPSKTGSPVAFVGTFPVMEAGVTTFALTVTCSNQPTVSLALSWTARWLS